VIRFVRDMVRVLGLPCREQAALLSRRLDGPLPPGIAAGVRIHTLYCRGCRAFRTQIRRLRDAARRIGGELNSGEAMPDEIRQRVLRRASESSKKI